MKDDDLSPVEVFAGTIIEAEMVKNLLENESIEAYLWNEIQGERQIIGIFNAVQVVVSRHDYLKAKGIVEEYLRKNIA